MKKLVLILITLFILVNVNLRSQVVLTGPEADFLLSKYRHKLRGHLYKNTDASSTVNYPKEASKDDIQGDVIFSILITPNGKIDRLNLIKSPHKILADHALSELNKVDFDWNTAKDEDTSGSIEYLLAFRYRIYTNAPPDIKKRCDRLMKKKKYKKALKLYNEEIADNKYESELFESRARVKELLGDKEGSIEDVKTSIFLKNNVMFVKTVIGHKSHNEKREKRSLGFAIQRSPGVAIRK